MTASHAPAPAPARVRPATVTSADGTTIAYQRVGAGPPVVVLPGALNGGDSWQDVAELLADSYTVLLVDRRFYPPSGDGPVPTSFAREVADVRAVIEAAGGRAHLVGHSYGGLLALHAALADPTGIASLALYEAPVQAPGPHVSGVLVRMRELLATGDAWTALELFLERVVQIAPADMAALVGDEAEPGPDEAADMIALVASVVHDVESLAAVGTPVAAWGSITVPTLLMAGARSWPLISSGTAALRAAMPAAELVTWPGQSHFANMMSPDLVADALRTHFAGVG